MRKEFLVLRGLKTAIGLAVLGIASACVQGAHAANTPCITNEPNAQSAVTLPIKKVPVAPLVQADDPGWISQGGITASAPSIVALGPDRLSLAVFAAGLNKHLYWRRVADKDGKWTDLGGGVLLTSAPSCVSQFANGSDRIDCFMRGGDYRVWQATIRSNFTTGWTTLGERILFSDWKTLEGPSTSGLSVVPIPARNAPTKGELSALAVLGVADGSVWAIRGMPSQIAGGDYNWEGWEKLNTGKDSLGVGLGCLSDERLEGWESIRCEAPRKALLQEFYPFVPLDKRKNHLVASHRLRITGSPAYISPESVLVYRSGHDTLSLSMDFDAKNPHPIDSDLGIVAKSSPSCTSVGTATTQPTFACAVEGQDGAVWVRTFQLAE